MRIFIVSKRSIFRVASAICLLAVSLAYTRLWLEPQSSAETMAQTRQIPVYRVDTGASKRIAISFDAAWGAEKTQEIVELLNNRGIRSTFFLVGFWVDKYPEKVTYIHENGHEIGNHTENHPHMTELSAEGVKSELETVSDKIEKITGIRPTLFRPPYGDYNNAVVTTARSLGYEVIQWDVDSLDWKDRGVQPMIDQVVSKVQPGSIVLFHNNSRDILLALPTILDELENKGYEIVPISELLLTGETFVDTQGIQRKK